MPPPTRGRGRGGRGGYSYPPDYYGYEDYYDYYGYDYHNYRGGYDDPYYGYDDFQGSGRGRGGRGGVRGGASQTRGRGAITPRGRLSFSQRGGPGTSRGELKLGVMLGADQISHTVVTNKASFFSVPDHHCFLVKKNLCYVARGFFKRSRISQEKTNEHHVVWASYQSSAVQRNDLNGRGVIR